MEKKAYPVRVLCEVMKVRRSGYYAYVEGLRGAKKIEKAQAEVRLIIEVQQIAKATLNSYGSRRMAKALSGNGEKVGRYRARTLMRKAKVECKQRRRYRITTQSNHHYPVAENVLNREFKVSAANKVWAADITYLWTHEGWLYVAAVLDLYSRRVVGWAIDQHMRSELIEKALKMGLGRRTVERGLMHHSDQGSQYASHEYQALLTQEGITVSMSRKGNCWDNAVMERFFGSLKSERTDHRKYITREEAKRDVIDYIEMFYNSQRLHSTLGYLTPLQYEHQNQFS